MNAEFLYQSYINTTTMMSVTSGTGTVANLFNRKKNKQYQSSGFNNDATQSSIVVSFTDTQTVSRIVLQNINLKDFTIYYNGVTANTLALSNALTTTSDWTGNSATNLYLYFSATNMTSFTIQASATMAANEEKKIGELWSTRQFVQLENNPSTENYAPAIDRQEYPHRMSDGGTSLYVLEENFKADIKLTFESETMRSNLYTLWNTWDVVVYAPFPTGTSWDDRIYENNWVGQFDFEKYSDNYIGNGFSGTIRLRETPK